MQSRSKKADSF